MEKGMAQGMAKGMEKGRAELVRNMLRKGLSIDSVVEYTDLPRREVEKLA
jgi:predicted transposase/invertase (TIGR01784 family)